MAYDTDRSEPCAITFPVAHLVPGRDTAAIARLLAVLRDFGFVPLAEYTARPHAVPEAERLLPGWAARTGPPRP